MKMGPLLSSSLIGTIDWGKVGIPTERADLLGAIKTVISTAYTIAGIAAVGFIIYSGYTIMIAAGDPQKLKKGQDSLAYAVVGLLIVIVSGVLINFLAGLFGVKDSILLFNIPFL